MGEINLYCVTLRGNPSTKYYVVALNPHQAHKEAAKHFIDYAETGACGAGHELMTVDLLATTAYPPPCGHTLIL